MLQLRNEHQSHNFIMLYLCCKFSYAYISWMSSCEETLSVIYNFLWLTLTSSVRIYVKKRANHKLNSCYFLDTNSWHSTHVHCFRFRYHFQNIILTSGSWLNLLPQHFQHSSEKLFNTPHHLLTVEKWDPVQTPLRLATTFLTFQFCSIILTKQKFVTASK
jgi:hypothetical protein